MIAEEIVVPEEIKTERLVLRRHAVRDGFGVNAGKPLSRVVFETVDGDRARLQEYLGWVDLTRTEGDSEAYLSQADEAWRKFEGFDYGFYLPTGEFIGSGGLHTVSKANRRAELGYWIASAYGGKGFVTEAIGEIVRACFRAGFHRLEIRCEAENVKSYGVAERLGFRLEGILREDCVEHGRWTSTRIYGALVSDF